MRDLWKKLGPDAERRLEAVVRDFYDTVFGDAMIGFHFFGKDKEKLVRLETQFATKMLGGKAEYQGRSIGQAHQDLTIFGGHFDRRQQILRETLARHDLPQAVRDAWLAHNERLRPLVTGDTKSRCRPEDVAPAEFHDESGSDPSDLRGRVAVITGASRGVGRAIARSLAQAGCHVVLAAKSTREHDRLPGTIYSVADEIRREFPMAAVLPIKCNVRREEEIQRVIERTRDELGRLDILVNNAGAAWWLPIEKTPPRKVDLVHEVNFRASHVFAHEALSMMKDQRYGHIIQISPPLSKPSMVEGKCAYMVSKLGMTYLTLALHLELEGLGIGAQSLWPVTMVESAATRNFGLGKKEDWRKPDIMGDALVAMVKRPPRENSGRAWLDEEALRELNGIEDFSSYACVPGSEPKDIPW